MAFKEIGNNELLEMYSLCRGHLHSIRRKPQLYTPVSITDAKKDLSVIETEISNRLPVEFKWEMEKIKQGLCPAGNIHPGEYYKHKVVGFIRIQIVDAYEFNGPVWTVRAFVKGFYINRFLVRAATIMEHYERV